MNILGLKLSRKGYHYLLTNIAMTVLFACLYYLTNYIDDDQGIKKINDSDSDSSKKLTLADALGYSLITQTTVGYTVFIPMTKYTRYVNMAQLFSIFLVLALFI